MVVQKVREICSAPVVLVFMVIVKPEVLLHMNIILHREEIRCLLYIFRADFFLELGNVLFSSQ
jgi:hypothetical protein